MPPSKDDFETRLRVALKYLRALGFQVIYRAKIPSRDGKKVNHYVVIKEENANNVQNSQSGGAAEMDIIAP